MRPSNLIPYVLKRLTNASASDLRRWVSKYPLIPAVLTAPPKLSSVNGILSLFPDVTPSSAEACRLEFLKDNKFFGALDKNMVEKRHRQNIWEEWFEFLYMAVRFRKPQIVFETGVEDGQSSAVILRALNENEEGKLVSIDLPSKTLPPNCQPGWAIPDYLRERHHLILGDSKDLLPRLFREYPNIDIFFHDSLHTFEHQYFEYTTSWPHLSEGGFLLSDDIFWSPAFYRFCKEKGRSYVRLEGTGRSGAKGDASFGALRK